MVFDEIKLQIEINIIMSSMFFSYLRFNIYARLQFQRKHAQLVMAVPLSVRSVREMLLKRQFIIRIVSQRTNERDTFASY